LDCFFLTGGFAIGDNIYFWRFMMHYCRVALVFAFLFISLTALSQVPVAVLDNLPDSPEDQPTDPFNVTTNDFDVLFGIDPSTVDLNTLTVGIQNNATTPEGDWVVDAVGNVVFTPTPNYFGSASINYTIQNASPIPVTSLLPVAINVTILPVNDDPTVTVIGNQTVQANTPTTPIPFTIGDVETGPGSLTVTGTSSNTTLVQDGSILLGGSGEDRTVTITPEANQSGTTTITITVDDGTTSTTTDFDLVVVAANTAPTISAITDQSTAQDTPTGAIAFTVGDAETAAGSLTVAGSSSNTTLAPVASISFGGSGANRTITITPAAGQSGTSTITITVSDGTDNVSTDFTLTVTAANTAPTISAIANQSTAQDTPTGAIAFTVGDAETAPGSLTVAGTSSNTTLVPVANISLGGSGANRTVTVTPAAGGSGTSTITLTVDDGTDDASTNFTLTVTAVNAPPTISAISNQSTPENTPTSAIAFTVGDPDNVVGTLTVTATSSNTTVLPNANIALGGGGPNRTVTLTPAANESGTTTITVTVSDGTATASTDFTLTVSDVNDAPTISAIGDQTTAENTATGAIAFTVSDAETAAADLTVSAASSNTALVPVANITFGGSDGNRTVTIDPGGSQSGTVTITITVSDGTATASTDFDLTIDPVNDAPTITPISDQTTAENTPTIAIPFNIGDAETPAANLLVSATSSVTTLVSNGNIDLGGSGSDRTITLTPTAGQSGTTEITINVSDGTATTSTSFTLTVSSVEDAPTITDISDQTITEDVATAALPFTLGDPDTPIADLVVTGSSSDKTLVPDANIVVSGSNISRSVVVTPAADQSGTTTITLTVSDGTATAATTFVVTVTAVNDAPVISAIANQTTDESTATPAIAFTVTDVDTPAASLVVTGASSNETLVPNANIVLGGSGENRNVVVTPANGQGGTATITLTVSDGTATTNGTFNLVISSVNDAPTISAISSQSTNEDVASEPISFTVGDAETAAASLIVTGSSSDKTLVPDANIAISNGSATRTVVLTPALNQNGNTTITLTVSDGTATAQATFQLTINPVNDPPVIASQKPITTSENTPITLVPDNFNIQDPDNTGGTLSVVVLPNSLFQVNGSTVTPPRDFQGQLTVLVKAYDGKLESQIFAAVINVTDITYPPVILGQNEIRKAVNTQWPLLITDLRTTDPDTPPDNLIVIALPGENYTVSGNALITPAADFIGELKIPVTVSDGTTTTAPFVLTVTIFQPGEEPSINGQLPLFMREDTPYDLNFLDLIVSDTDTKYPEGGFSMSLGDGENYTVAGRTITPALNFNDILEIPVTVNDGEFSSNTFMVKILVRPVNDPPEITALESNTIFYEPGSGPTPITETFECVDVDSEFLTLAEVRLIDPFYSADNDELIFENSDSSPIRGIYDVETGKLSLIGYATIADYIAAIRSIQYNYRLTTDINGEPSQISTEPKTLEIRLGDGEFTSEPRTRTIELETLVDLDIANTFTPNGDMSNDTWAIEPLQRSDQFAETVVKVYNKRGLLVWETVGLDLENRWDGTYNGELLPPDTYYYTINLNVSFIKKTYKGAVMIVH
jgi:gliding motility-associated-like protein